MCGRIWVPRPRINLPFEYVCRSQPTLATIIGLRANATAMLVPSSSRDVCSAASSSGRKGSWLASAVQPPSKPLRSSATAASAARASWLGMLPSSLSRRAPPIWVTLQ
ncbi:Uncharacterised protein [Mycobacterium tuberculosis]|nr:Uncharacterised protein [Mycobacterium tuberculosis]